MARITQAEVDRKLAILDNLFQTTPRSRPIIANAIGVDKSEINAWIIRLRDHHLYTQNGAVGAFKPNRGEWLYGYCDMVEQYFAWELRQLKRVIGKARRQTEQAKLEMVLHPTDSEIRASVRYWQRAMEDAEDRKAVVETIALVQAW